MLDLVAPIYRRLIYEFLFPEEIACLGETCKTIYQDKNRNDLMVSKLSSNFRYKVDKYYWRDEYMIYSLMTKDLQGRLSQELKKRIVSLKFQEIENLSFEDKRYLVIHFPLELFFLCDIQSQKEITLFLCDQLFHMWDYAEKNKMNMTTYESRCPEEFDLYPFYNFIQNTLENIFYQSCNETKYVLIGRLIELTNITRNISPKLSKNEIYVNIFIYTLFRGDISRLVEIIDAGIFFKKYFPSYLRDYLDNIIGAYIEVNESYEDTGYDIYAIEVEKILDQKNKTYRNLTNADVLDDLLLECKLFSVSLVREANLKRKERWLESNLLVKPLSTIFKISDQ
jgi:hypothetical protein